MPRGGFRPNSGRKGGKDWHGRRGERSKSYRRMMQWADQLWDVGQKEKAVRIYQILLQHDEPKLTAVAAQVSTQVTYVARLPAPIMDIDEWQIAVTPLIESKK
jgi:hypothetical protein